jgi:hypothetical protein
MIVSYECAEEHGELRWYRDTLVVLIMDEACFCLTICRCEEGVLPDEAIS